MTIEKVCYTPIRFLKTEIIDVDRSASLLEAERGVANTFLDEDNEPVHPFYDRFILQDSPAVTRGIPYLTRPEEPGAHVLPELGAAGAGEPALVSLCRAVAGRPGRELVLGGELPADHLPRAARGRQHGRESHHARQERELHQLPLRPL